MDTEGLLATSHVVSTIQQRCSCQIDRKRSGKEETTGWYRHTWSATVARKGDIARSTDLAVFNHAALAESHAWCKDGVRLSSRCAVQRSGFRKNWRPRFAIAGVDQHLVRLARTSPGPVVNDQTEQRTESTSLVSTDIRCSLPTPRQVL